MKNIIIFFVFVFYSNRLNGFQPTELYLLLISPLTAFLYSCTSSILGGRDVNIWDSPYQVNYADKCGAALVHKKWALTTAHCGHGTFIRVGSRDRLKGAKVQISLHLVHPSYQLNHDFDYDVQLLRLFRGLRFGKLVDKVEICSGHCGGKLRVFGWGYAKEKGEYNDILQEIEVHVVSIEECQRVQQSWYNHTLTSSMFCAGERGKDACQGDSGGAAVWAGRLVGLCSFGYGCGRALPGVYTNLSHGPVRHWIRKHTGV